MMRPSVSTLPMPSAKVASATTAASLKLSARMLSAEIQFGWENRITDPRSRKPNLSPARLEYLALLDVHHRWTPFHDYCSALPANLPKLDAEAALQLLVGADVEINLHSCLLADPVQLWTCIQQTSLTSSGVIGASGSGGLKGSSPSRLIAFAIAVEASVPVRD